MNIRDIKHSARELIQLAQLDQWYDYESMDSDTSRESIYLGSVLSIMPSGKYYTPWASTNIDSCSRCHGTGQTKKSEVCQYCKGLTYRTVSQMAVIRKESYSKCYDFMHSIPSGITWITTGCFQCNVCNGTGIYHPTCKHCQGMGSREAYEDSVMSESLDKFAESLNQWIESGEGDPLDLFLVREKVDTESIE